MVVFCCLPGSDGAETELRGRDGLVLIVSGPAEVIPSMRTSGKKAIGEDTSEHPDVPADALVCFSDDTGPPARRID